MFWDSIYLFPALHIRPLCRTILQAAYTRVQCSTDSPAPVASYRLAKYIFLKGHIFPLLHVRPSYKTILQTVQCSTDSLASVALYRLRKCIYQIINFVFSLYFGSPRIVDAFC